MYSVFVGTLGLVLVALAAMLVVRRKWFLAGLPLSIAAVAFVLSFRGNGQAAFDFVCKAVNVVMFLCLGIYPWTTEGKKHAEAAHLSIGGAKVLGGIFLFLGLLMVVALTFQAFEF